MRTRRGSRVTSTWSYSSTSISQSTFCSCWWSPKNRSMLSRLKWSSRKSTSRKCYCWIWMRHSSTAWKNLTLCAHRWSNLISLLLTVKSLRMSVSTSGRRLVNCSWPLTSGTKFVFLPQVHLSMQTPLSTTSTQQASSSSTVFTVKVASRRKVANTSKTFECSKILSWKTYCSSTTQCTLSVNSSKMAFQSPLLRKTRTI